MDGDYKADGTYITQPIPSNATDLSVFAQPNCIEGYDCGGCQNAWCSEQYGVSCVGGVGTNGWSCDGMWDTDGLNAIHADFGKAHKYVDGKIDCYTTCGLPFFGVALTGNAPNPCAWVGAGGYSFLASLHQANTNGHCENPGVSQHDYDWCVRMMGQ